MRLASSSGVSNSSWPFWLDTFSISSRTTRRTMDSRTVSKLGTGSLIMGRLRLRDRLSLSLSLSLILLFIASADLPRGALGYIADGLSLVEVSFPGLPAIFSDQLIGQRLLWSSPSMGFHQSPCGYAASAAFIFHCPYQKD